jgi:predicted Na+-dependent transporter
MLCRPHVKFFSALVILLAAIVLQVRLRDLGIGFENAALASLIALSFFLSASEALSLAAFGALVLNWKSAASVEMALFIILPLIAVFLRRVFLTKVWPGNLFLVVAGVLFFCLLSNPPFPATSAWVFAEEIITAAIFGMAVFGIMNWAYAPCAEE